MALASLLNAPSTPTEQLKWSFSNADAHSRIVTAIRSQIGTVLTPFVLDPIPEFDRQNWLRRHQQAHTDFTAVLGIDGSDLSEVNWQDQEEREAWVQLHFEEHFQANNILRI